MPTRLTLEHAFLFSQFDVFILFTGIQSHPLDHLYYSGLYPAVRSFIPCGCDHVRVGVITSFIHREVLDISPGV